MASSTTSASTLRTSSQSADEVLVASATAGGADDRLCQETKVDKVVRFPETCECDVDLDDAFHRGEEAEAHPTFSVKLDRNDEGQLGIAFRAEPRGIMITGLLVGSPAVAWNTTADAVHSLSVGDIIVAVNSERVTKDATSAAEANCEALVDELVDGDGECELTVRCFGPRWHVQGVTSICLARVESAIDEGLLSREQLEPFVFTEETIVKESDLKLLGWGQFALVLAVVALPTALVLALCSAMGMGFALFSTLAAPICELAGNGISFLTACAVVGMYMVDWHKWESKKQQAISAFLVVYSGAFAGFLKSRSYPQAPMVVLLFHIPILIGALRSSALGAVRRASFYKTASVATFLPGLGALVLWLVWMNMSMWDGMNVYNDATKMKLADRSSAIYEQTLITIDGHTRPLDYVWDCRDKEPLDFDLVVEVKVPRTEAEPLTVEESLARAAACGEVKTIWFLVYTAPLVAAVTNLVISAFCAINGVMMPNDDVTRAEKTLKHFVSMFVVLMLCMWVGASVAGASMRLTGTIMAFCGAAVVALFLWVCFEVGTKVLSSALRESKLMAQLLAVVTNDWFRAAFLLGPGFLLPLMLCVEVLKQRVRRLRGETASRATLTPEAYGALDYFRNWNWGSICTKANFLVIGYFVLSVFIAKVTVVFLAWLNEVFEKSVPFVWVVVIFFWIGFTMFMLPPVPGIPVYITSGIIIAAKARSIPSIGFSGGILIAIALSFVLKISAVCGQYCIGLSLGKSVKTQKEVGVDKVPIRAVEKLLLQRGLCIGKVAVLVGGPDWPTSVLCGILRLSLFQCCLGTVPVLLVSSPCVLAGAFLAGPSADMEESAKSVWDALANTALALSAAGQLASGVLAMYYIQATITKHGEELAEYRPEHEQVKQLSLAEQDMEECVQEVLDWRTLPTRWLRLMVGTTMSMIGAFFIFMMMDELCFRSFQVKDKISDPEGLNCPDDFGCALLRLVKPPFGWGALALFFGATVLHVVFVKHIINQAKSRLAWKKANGLLNTRRRSSRRRSVRKGDRPSVLHGEAGPSFFADIDCKVEAQPKLATIADDEDDVAAEPTRCAADGDDDSSAAEVLETAV